MDAITQHRKKRLEQLISAEPYKGDRAAFMVATKLSKGRVSQLLDPAHKFGELAAGKLCKVLGLPEGWFEKGAPGKPVAWPFLRLTQDQAASLDKDNRESVENLALTLWRAQKSIAMSESSYGHNESPGGQVKTNPRKKRIPPAVRKRYVTPEDGVEVKRGTGSQSEGGRPRKGRGS